MSPTPANRKHIAHLAKVKRQSQIIKYVTIGVFAVVIVVLLSGLLLSAGFPPYTNVARAGGEALSADEFKVRVKLARLNLINQYQQTYLYAQFFGVDPATDQNFSGQLQQIIAQLDETGKEALGEQVINNWLEEVIIAREAEELGFSVSAEELDIAIKEEGFGFYANGTPTPEPTATAIVEPTLNPTVLALVTVTPTPSPFPTAEPTVATTPEATATPDPAATPEATATPEPTATPYTLEGFNTRYAEILDQYGTDTGITEEQFKQIIFAGSLLREKVFEEITKDVKSTEEQVWARHILVATEEEAKQVIQRLNNGDDWAVIAQEVSLDTSNKDMGGDLNWFGKGMMVAEFEEAAFALKPGEISQPVQTTFGFHIIQVIAHEDRALTQDQIDQAKQAAFSEWLSTKKEDIKLTTYDFWKNIVPLEPGLQGQ